MVPRNFDCKTPPKCAMYPRSELVWETIPRIEVWTVEVLELNFEMELWHANTTCHRMRHLTRARETNPNSTDRTKWCYFFESQFCVIYDSHETCSISISRSFARFLRHDIIKLVASRRSITWPWFEKIIGKIKIWWSGFWSATKFSRKSRPVLLESTASVEAIRQSFSKKTEN